ncbi:JmjC domain-containing protein [Abeliophyllum distichum]|uniref:JmjC domain-containing protein n=1 Tax=Abeliophyllum distichum TaxID=126358 RepID=A0ABD1TYG5_9LAMI
MAPKRKDPPTKKGKEKAGSSSGRNRQLETNVDAGGIRRFRGPEEELIYNKWLMPKHIWAEREEFFANFNQSIEDPATDHQYTTWVRGKWIQFSPAVIAHYYELPALDFEPIPADFDMTQVAQFLYGRADAWPLAGPKFLHNQLTESLRIFHIFVCHNIDPTSHRTDFKDSRAQFLYHLASGHRIDLGEHIFRFIVELASQYASGRSPMFPCLISALCLAGGVPLLPHEEPENHEPPITKRTLGNPVARRAADNPAPPPAAETDRLLRQMFTQLSEQGRVLNSIQRTQLAMQRTVDHMRIEIDSLRESNNTLRGGATDYQFHLRRCQPPHAPVCAAPG